MGELIVNGIKWGFIIAVGSTFAVAILSLLNLLSTLVFSNIIGEILGLISVCLPFNAGAVFSSLMLTMTAILSFMVAQKIYDLVSQHVKI